MIIPFAFNSIYLHIQQPPKEYSYDTATTLYRKTDHYW